MGADGSFLTCYSDVRDAFEISDEESIPILRQLLEESQVWKRRNSTLNDESWDLVRYLMQRDFEGFRAETSSAWSRHEAMNTESKVHRQLLDIWLSDFGG
ncbi:hypothetical protein PG996_008396 [Apiospora saccharicola]|uniref:Uncharacterized protein n=1 Tax=Apiospora saccharicola TaxID=335842 RepID=A0ABR1UXS9_9PEZI